MHPESADEYGGPTWRYTSLFQLLEWCAICVPDAGEMFMSYYKDFCAMLFVIDQTRIDCDMNKKVSF